MLVVVSVPAPTAFVIKGELFSESDRAVGHFLSDFQDRQPSCMINQ